VFQRFPTDLECQPLLRVHQFRFARGDTEELGIEAGQVVDETSPASGVFQHRRVARVSAQIRLPALGGYLRDVAAALEQEGPELRGIGDAARQATADADDRDRFGVDGRNRWRILVGRGAVADHVS
jgi:hypothetical protein